MSLTFCYTYLRSRRLPRLHINLYGTCSCAVVFIVFKRKGLSASQNDVRIVHCSLLNWRVSWLSWLAVVTLVLLTILLYVIPIRYLFLVWGLIHITRKLRRPGAVHHSGLLDFLLRVPSNKQLVRKAMHFRAQGNVM